MVLAHLFNHIDRSRFEPLLVSGLDDDSLAGLFKPADIFFHFRRKLNYVSRSRWMECCPSSITPIRKLWAYLFSMAEWLLNSVQSLELLLKLIVQRPDVIHDNNDRNAVRWASWLNIPLVCHLHGLASAEYYALPQVRRACRVVSISDYVANVAIERGLDAEKVCIIPNPTPEFVPDLSERWQYLAKFGVEPGQIVIGHVGRLVRWKGQMEFLQAFNRALNGRKNVVALIIGDDVEGYTQSYRRSLEEFVEQSGIAGQVKFTGHSNEVLRMMSYCDVVVHSSIEPEPFGLVITEAMAAGAAVIASKLGAPSEIIEDMKTGILVDPFDISEFAQALERLIVDGDLRRAIARSGKQMAEERYSPQVFARDMESVYEAAVAEH